MFECAPAPNFAPRVINLAQSGTALRLHPFWPNVAAVGGGQNFGISGKGSQAIITVLSSLNEQKIPTPNILFESPQVVLGCAWSEFDPNIVASALGNGQIYLWNLSALRPELSKAKTPQSVLRQHLKECCSLDWNVYNTQHLLSTAWDACVCIWDTHSEKLLLNLAGVHRKSVQQGVWSPTQASVFATGGGDGNMKILDIRTKLGTQTDIVTSQTAARVLSQQVCHEGGELLSLDWNKYQPFIIATSGTEEDVRVWDIRNIGKGGASSALLSLKGHHLPVKTVRWSPFHGNILATGSYDMSVIVWDVSATQTSAHSSAVVNPQYCYQHHSEFVISLDWSLFHDSMLASTSWDKTMVMWNALSGTSILQS